MSKDWTGNKKSAFSTLGAKGHASEERERNDYYATDPTTIIDLFKYESFDGLIWEPACGEGHLSKEIELAGYSVFSSDLIDRGYGTPNMDFLSIVDPQHDINIITNPPYKYATDFVYKAMELIDTGKKLAMFLKLTFLETKERYELFKLWPPKTVYVYSKRVCCAKNGDFSKAENATAYAWYVWVKGFTADPSIKFIMR